MPSLCPRPVEIESKGHSSVDNGCTSSGTAVPPSRAPWTSALPFISCGLQEKQQEMHGPAGTSITLAALSCRAENWEEMAIKLQVQIKNCI